MSISTPNPSTITNEYKLATLALLSSAEPLTQIKALSGTIVSTIEDYLFSYLWDVVQPSSPSSAPPPQNWNDKIRKLSNIVKRWGPQHFEAENESVLGGWGYTMPLLLTQQYESALIHLAEHGKNKPLLLSQSTHLGILLNFAGIDLVDLKPQQDGAERRMLDHSISSMQLLTSLLVSYSVSFQSVDPEAALEYLVRIPPDADNNSRENNNTNSNKSSTEKHVARLIRETRAFETLVGSVSIDGTRVSQDGKAGGGALDAHFSPSEVSSILLDAAQSFVQESNVRDAAELLALAGRYSDLIMLLNRELGSLLVVLDGDQEKKEQREFWNNVSIQFYNAYLSSGRTHVQEVLESENNMHLLETFKQLLNLMEFFNRCSQHNWSEAWSLINELKLIPSSDQDIPYQLDSFGNYDESLKKSFHFTVLASMECLYHQYMEAKNNGNALLMRANRNDIIMHDNSNSSGMMIQQHLDELRRRARILVTYAGLLQMESSAETHARIARMEAYMM